MCRSWSQAARDWGKFWNLPCYALTLERCSTTTKQFDVVIGAHLSQNGTNSLRPNMIDVSALSGMRKSHVLEPYINHIRFPHFKNLEDDTRIDFDFPITALVGPNGANKSSVLKALFGAPGNNNLGTRWFSTQVDPIDEAGGALQIYLWLLEPADEADCGSHKDAHSQNQEPRLLGTITTNLE